MIYNDINDLKKQRSWLEINTVIQRHGNETYTDGGNIQEENQGSCQLEASQPLPEIQN